MSDRLTHTFDDRHRLLLTEGSSSSARQTLYGLGRRYAIGVIDPSRLCMCRFSRLVERFHRSPSYARAPVEYLQFLLRTVRQGRYDVLFPTHEEVYLLSRFRERLRRDVAVALPDFDALRTMQNKADFVRLFKQLDLPQPETKIVDSFAALDASSDYPCYIKLPHSTAGTGVRLVGGVEDVRRVEEEFRSSGQLEHVSEIVVQQPVTGRQSVVQTVFDQGRLVASHCTEALSVGIGGGQMLRVSADHPTVVRDMRCLGEYLNWHGAMFLEYFYDADHGRPCYIEANPRIGETMNARLCGLNLCDLLVRISLGEHVPEALSAQAGVRSHVGFLLLIAVALRGATRRDIMREWWHVARGTGPYHDAENEMTRPGEDWASVIPAGATLVELLLRPRLAHHLVRTTVDNYGLPESAALAIDQMTLDID
ncbi:MAG: hypothetical protein ACC645_04720 [Pirellulales bacterium]